jgi:hypothetical protein
MAQRNGNSLGVPTGHFNATPEPYGHNMGVAYDLQQSLGWEIEGVLRVEPGGPPSVGEATRVPLREMLQHPDRR